MAIIGETNMDIGVPEPTENSNIFRNLALNILGDSVLNEKITLIEDEDSGEYEEIYTYTVKPHCENMVASVTWSCFLTFTLLLFGFIRTLFNMFRGGDK